jgi:hypothetical protein
MIYLSDLGIPHFQVFPDEKDLISKESAQEHALVNLYIKEKIHVY